MKTNVLILFVSIVFLSCGTKNTDNIQTVNEDHPEANQGELPEETIADTEPIPEALNTDERITEELFFFIRNKIAALDKNTFVRYENLSITAKSFRYTLVQTDIALLEIIPENINEQAGIFNFSTLIKKSQLHGDTLIVEGNLLNDFNFQTPETLGKLIEVKVSGNIEYAVVQDNSPYGYGYGSGQKMNIIEPFEETIVVDIVSPRIYSKDELYLKARVVKLSENDLKGLTKEQLALLRNEIFARHGHAFKTSKMKEYFNKMPWYYRCNADATNDLNSIETENVQFIKSLES